MKTAKLKEIILKSARRNRLIARLIADLKYVYIHFLHKASEQKLLDEIVEYYDKDMGNRVGRIIKDIIFSTLYYGVKPAEYCFFGFEKASCDERRTYISDSEVLKMCDQISSVNKAKKFRDKYEAYLQFTPYYKRECILVEGDSISKIDEFTKRYNKFVIKPLDSSRGNGIYKVDMSRDNYSIDDIAMLVEKNGKYIFEEYIDQFGLLKELHPDSVNTIRYVTFLDEMDEVVDVYAILRMGRGNCNVDNINAGGVFANIDLDSGIVSTPACDLKGNRYLFHPDTGVQIIGQRIPDWEKLKELVKKIAHVVPEQKYVGWDFAYTKKGWVMVEGNHRPGCHGPQVSMKSGMRKRIECTLGTVANSMRM